MLAEGTRDGRGDGPDAPTAPTARSPVRGYTRAGMSLPPIHGRPAASVAAVALVSVLAAGACTTGATADRPAVNASMAVASTATDAIEGWPMPGQAATTSFIPVLASAENVVGRSRFLLTLVDRANKPIASPDRAVSLSFFDLAKDPRSPAETVATDFVWAIEGERGFYVAYVDFAEAGEWGVQVDVSKAGGAPESARVRFDVQAKGTTIAVGQKAPSVQTLTVSDVGGDVHRISTDTSPDAGMYQTSVKDALARHEPFVLVFATPAFCTSRVCGPTLELVKKVKATEPGVTFINVEPYELTWKDGSLQPVRDASGQLTPVAATDAFGLLVEPWIFVVDRDGIVRGSFEAVVSEKELRGAIEAAK